MGDVDRRTDELQFAPWHSNVDERYYYIFSRGSCQILYIWRITAKNNNSKMPLY